MSNEKHYILYKLIPKPEGVTREEIEALDDPDMGACDAVVILSMIYPEDGSFSLGIISGDGRTCGPVSPAEKWKVWAMMARALSEDEALSPGKRAFAEVTWKAIRERLRSGEMDLAEVVQQLKASGILPNGGEGGPGGFNC